MFLLRGMRDRKYLPVAVFKNQEDAYKYAEGCIEDKYVVMKVAFLKFKNDSLLHGYSHYDIIRIPYYENIG